MDATARITQALLQARHERRPLHWQQALPADVEAACAVQEATAAALGGIAGWKVGAASPTAQPSCAPLPRGALLPMGSQLPGPLRGIEVEVALRLGRDLEADVPPDPRELQQAVDQVLPAIEVVETRLDGWRDAAPLAQMADLQSHGALVLGRPAAIAPAEVDLRRLLAYLAFDGQPVASARGAHAAGDCWRLLGWLVVHCTRRGHPLRAGQVVTTGSCSGLLFAPAGAQVDAELLGVGRVSLSFAP